MPRSIFVNLSNHPSAGWDEFQRAAALELAGEIRDVPFPRVPPEAELTEVEALARRTVEALPEEASHAMVMGESTATLALVLELQRRALTCLAATTEREVHADAEGRKVTRFRFVRFRPYPAVSRHAPRG